jgi:hypothetical protein
MSRTFCKKYDEWNKSRFFGIKKYIKEEYFNSKTLLELGCGHAHNGNSFHELGSKVSSCDARVEHVEIAKELYPHIKLFVMDCDQIKINQTFDIILHWGLLYHLNEIENHLKIITSKCDILLLETEVSDSNDDTFFITTKECGPTQAFNTKGIRPSRAYVEKVLEHNNFRFLCVDDDSDINAGMHIYNWKSKNTETWEGGQRRFWICWKKSVDSPLIK